jgi:hypothetical protein
VAQAASNNVRSVVSSEIIERFWPVNDEVAAKEGERLIYRPGLLGIGRVHFVKAAEDIDVWRDVAAVQSVHGELASPPWETAMLFEKKPSLADGPEAGAAFEELPSALAQAKNYKSLKKELVDHLYQHERLVLWRCEEPSVRSNADETEEEFRARAAALSAKQLGARQEEIKRGYAAKLEKARDAVAKAELRVAAEKSQFWMRLLGMLGRIAEVLLMSFAGKRSRKKMVTSTSAGAALRDRQQQSRAAEQLVQAQGELQDVEAKMQAELAAVEAGLKPEGLTLERVEVPPRKGDIDVDEVSLVWLPWRVDKGKNARPAY